jgi:hypothetical protein
MKQVIILALSMITIFSLLMTHSYKESLAEAYEREHQLSTSLNYYIEQSEPELVADREYYYHQKLLRELGK